MRDSILMLVLASAMIFYATASIAGEEKLFQICYKQSEKSVLVCNAKKHSFEDVHAEMKAFMKKTNYKYYGIKEVK